MCFEFNGVRGVHRGMQRKLCRHIRCERYMGLPKRDFTRFIDSFAHENIRSVLFAPVKIARESLLDAAFQINQNKSVDGRFSPQREPRLTLTVSDSCSISLKVNPLVGIGSPTRISRGLGLM